MKKKSKLIFALSKIADTLNDFSFIKEAFEVDNVILTIKEADYPLWDHSGFLPLEEIETDEDGTMQEGHDDDGKINKLVKKDNDEEDEFDE